MPDAKTQSAIVIEKLTKAHDMEGFDCSNAVLDNWLKKFAWSSQQAETAMTYVAHRGLRVVGYHSLVAGSVSRDRLPERIAKGTANQPVNVVLIARLAVDRREQGKGLGKALLRDALARTSNAADVVGVRAVLVHAIDDSARSFYLHQGFQPSPVDPTELMMLTKDLRASIAAAHQPSRT